MQKKLSKFCRKLLISEMDGTFMKSEILGVKFDNVSLMGAQEGVSNLLSKPSSSSKKGFYIVTPNPEFVIESLKDRDLQRILNEADLSIPDGIGVLWASRILGRGIEHRCGGADLVELLLREGNEKNWVFFFLGGKGNTAKSAAHKTALKYPHLKIGYLAGEPGVDFDKTSLESIKDFAAREGIIDILLVAYGQNKQEKWIDRNKTKIPVKISIGVGGVLDYIAGNRVRAPKIVRDLGLEWLFRLVQEPNRFRRQLALPKFVYLVIKEKLLPPR